IPAVTTAVATAQITVMIVIIHTVAEPRSPESRRPRSARMPGASPGPPPPRPGRPPTGAVPPPAPWPPPRPGRRAGRARPPAAHAQITVMIVIIDTAAEPRAPESRRARRARRPGASPNGPAPVHGCSPMGAMAHPPAWPTGRPGEGDAGTRRPDDRRSWSPHG